jgi:chromosome partitioning protein
VWPPEDLMRLRKRPGWGFSTGPAPGSLGGLEPSVPIDDADPVTLDDRASVGLGSAGDTVPGDGTVPSTPAQAPPQRGMQGAGATLGPHRPAADLTAPTGSVETTGAPAEEDPGENETSDEVPPPRAPATSADRSPARPDAADLPTEHLDDAAAGASSSTLASTMATTSTASAPDRDDDDAAALGEGATTAPARLPLPRVIAIANQKGGVGKTTTTVNLGAALAELGYRVLVIDLDPQGNATTGLGIDARNFEVSMYDVIMRDAPIVDCVEPTSVKNLFVAPATIDLAGVEIELVSAFSRELKVRRAVDSVVEDFDYVLIDCPPSLGLITVNGLAAAREVLVPIQCEYYALEGLGQLLRNVHLVATNLNDSLEVRTIVLTMFDARTRLAIDVATEVRQHFAEKVCRSVIPRTVRLSEAPSFGQPITVFDPTSRGAVAYRDLAREVSDGAPTRVG